MTVPPALPSRRHVGQPRQRDLAPRGTGLFGGSFDPVHAGHVAAAEEAADALRLARVILVPANVSPHKLPTTRASGGDRLAMARLAVEGRRRLEVSDVEVRRRPPSYTVDTVRELREELSEELGPGVELHLLMGSDTLREIHTWRDVRGIFERAEPAVIERPGEDPIDWDDLALTLPGEVVRRARASVVRLTRGVEVSSTEVRRRLGAGEGVEGLVPPEVERYIRERGLYGAGAS